VNQDTVGSLPLAGVAGHCIAKVEMRMPARVEFNHTTEELELRTRSEVQYAIRMGLLSAESLES
jgi:hypothetical protein